ncbi:PAAR-like protein [Flavobacterium sp. PL002]|uniref:PAAR-like protein n=1 Tax=Flavobacterium sp. PL002 TaxID=1897058 RepID=UPI0017889AF6|nr:PAAR-like protein [Flavobacterium sp. PL002]MBE0392399.1 hypothetical protein [Flavobacterium sp. PL002]
MASPIPYLIQQGDTLSSVALKLGIKDEYYLKRYHNNNCELKNQTGGTLKAGEILLTPPPDEIEEMNRKIAISQQEDVEEKAKKEGECTIEEEKKEEEAKKEEETKKGEHEGKYFVVHGATCICDKAEDPSKTAKLKVTSHEKVVFNDEDGKYVATADDTTLDPPAATFGKCTLKPSSSGNQPCAFSPAGKWQKFYEKTKIADKPLLTEISILQCTIGGKVTIKKHGQTNTVTKEHAENTTPVELAMINPAVKMPLQQPSYPDVSYITLKSIENRPDFKARSSNEAKTVEKILVRPNEMCRFEAKLGKGNKDLTSWLVYDGSSGDKENRLMIKEQHGIVLEEAFGTVGNYRIEGYGKPKQGVHDKNYASCSLDIDVVPNTLEGVALETLEGENFARKKGNKMQLRQNFPANFAAKFVLPPTDQELEHLQMQVTDASGNTVESTTVNSILTFIPLNSKAQYTVTAQYTLATGAIALQTFTGETVGNAVTGITHNAEKIRPGTPMTFEIKTGVFSYFIPNEESVNEEISQVKWNLNGRLMGTGKSITLPGHQFMTKQKYVVEAYSKTANAFGTTAKDEEDDWRFEVVDNDVVSFKCLGVPKVGKTTRLQVSAFIIDPLIATEQVVWSLPIKHATIDKKTIAITPTVAGKQSVKCGINNQPGKISTIDVKQAKIHGMLFTDSNGIEIQRASWGQKVNIWLKQEHLVDEEITVEIWDKDYFSFNDHGGYINNKSYDGNLLSFSLNKAMKDETGSYAKLYIKVVAPKLTLANGDNKYESNTYLEVEDEREIYGAHIGSQDGKDRHYHVDYDKISYFYAKSRGIKPDEQLNLKIYEKGKAILEAKNVYADESGMIKIKLEWNLLNPKTAMRIVYAVIKDKDENILYNGAKVATGPLVITKKSAILKLAEYKSAVMVGKGSGGSGGGNGVCVCKEYDLLWGNKLTCDERKKVVQICKKLWPQKNSIEMANHLMVCIAVETGGTFDPAEGHPAATGLIQWTGSAINGMNANNKYNKGEKLTKLKLSKMKILEQLDYVELYFKMWIDSKKVISDSLDMYMCIWCPAAVGKRDDYICYSIEKDKKIKENDPTTNYQPYNANKSIDGEFYQEKGNLSLSGNKNGELSKGELRPRLSVKKVEGLNYKAKITTCKSLVNDNSNEDGVLAEMKKLVDKHIPYSMEGIRNSLSEDGLKNLDCSETVGIYLYKLGVMPNLKSIDTGIMTTETAFRNTIGSQNIDLVANSDKKDFKPQRGDIFVWRRNKKEHGKNDGHTGIVYEYDEATDIVTILEAIGDTGAVSEKDQAKNGGYSETGCSRTAKYKRLKGAMYGHDGWKGFFRPKNYTKKL